MEDAPETLCVVIPAYNAATTLPRVLPALLRAAAGTTVLLVDAGSEDESAELAERLGAEVIRSRRRLGPAAARNLGVQCAAGDVTLFLDADCVPHPDAISRVRAAFGDDPDLVSLTGSYDPNCPDKGFFSQYMNLRHYFTHQVARREKATFWAGCGAVRTAVFRRVGGFDAERYPKPEIEDIELGLRLAEHGRMKLDPKLQVTHLKSWTLRSVVETDICHRALPWSRLILERGALPDDLNLRVSQRIAAALAPCVLAGLAALPAAAIVGSAWAVAPVLALLAASLLLHAQMLRVFAHQRGLRFAVLSWLFHQLHLTYSAGAFVWSACRHALRAT